MCSSKSDRKQYISTINIPTDLQPRDSTLFKSFRTEQFQKKEGEKEERKKKKEGKIFFCIFAYPPDNEVKSTRTEGNCDSYLARFLCLRFGWRVLSSNNPDYNGKLSFFFLPWKLAPEQRLSELAFWQSLLDHWTLEQLVRGARWTDSGQDPRDSQTRKKLLPCYVGSHATFERIEPTNESVRKSFKTSDSKLHLDQLLEDIVRVYHVFRYLKYSHVLLTNYFISLQSCSHKYKNFRSIAF